MYRDEEDRWTKIILAIILMVVFFGISSCVNDLGKKEVEACMTKGGQWTQVSRDHFYCAAPLKKEQ